MIFKLIKLGTLATGGALLASGLVFGTELGSYVRSSYHDMRASVKDNIPVDFQLRRARDLLAGVDPELHNNIRLVAEQEVEIANLKTELEQGQNNLVAEKSRIEKVRNCLNTQQTSFEFSGLSYTRGQLTQDLGRQFTHYKEAETALAAKTELLSTRERSLAAAMDAMETAKAQKATLEAQIDGLEAQYHLVQAATPAGCETKLDNSKLSQAQQVVGDIRKQLAVAEHVLAHEATFTPEIPVDQVNEKDLLTQVDEHFGDKSASARAGN